MKFCALLSLMIVPLILHADSANSLHNYMWANYQQFSGNQAQAEHWYKKVTNDQSSLFSNKGYVHFLFDHGDFGKVVELMPKLEEHFKNDPDLQLIFVMALRKTNNGEKADAKLINISRDFKTHPEIVFNTAETLIRRKESQNALAVIDDFLNNTPRRPNNFIFYFLKAQIYHQLQDIAQARSNIQLCLEAHPRFPQGLLLLAMIEEQAGQIHEAMKGFTSYLEASGPNKQIEQHLLSLAIRQKSSQESRQLLFVNKSCMSKAMLLFERKEYRAAVTQIDECLTKTPNDPELRLLKVQALQALNEHDELLKTVVAWADQEPDNDLWLKTLHLLCYTQVPLVRIINALNSIQTHHPTKLLPHLYLADALTKNGDRVPAIAHHKKALALITDQQLKARVLYQIALLQYEERLYPEMLATVKDIGVISPTYPAADNLVAYYYATAGKDLKKAQYHFEKAYNADKGNPHFLDTQAVIYYKQQQYDKAIALLQPLAQQLPDDSSILIHLAKSYHKIGKTNEAQETILKAQKCAATSYEKNITNQLRSTWQRT